MPLAAAADVGNARQRGDSTIAPLCAIIGYGWVTPSQVTPASAIIGHLKIAPPSGTNRLQAAPLLATI